MLLKLSAGGLCLKSCACNQRSQTSPGSHLLFSAVLDILKKSAQLVQYMSLQTDRKRQKITGSTTRTVTCTHYEHSTCTHTSHSMS